MSDESDYLILAAGVLAFLLCGSGTKSYVDSNRASAQIHIEARKEDNRLKRQESQRNYERRFCESVAQGHQREIERRRDDVAKISELDKTGLSDEDKAIYRQTAIDMLNYHLTHTPVCVYDM
ncbi:hypothetical protein [Pseudomonas oryzihabitans]|uniref:hypothetical protein n=1 Tax=Pseudomonas oryzihabitans TaxID=47885 RepID=UPI001269ED97|nr:hypothetical protein [Pseudomonas oryzihabitans]